MIAQVGTPSVTAVAVSGSIGADNYYRADLASSGPVTNGSVVATENVVALDSAGMAFERRVGTATYSPTTGDVTVVLPTAATNSVRISATGINMGGQQINNVADGTQAMDAVNRRQLDTVSSNLTALSTSLNASLASFQSSVNGTLAGFSSRLDRFEEEANAGTAIAIALGGGAFQPDRKINITVNYCNYEGESAIAGQIGVLLGENVALNAGVATGFDRGGTGFRVGGTVGF